MPKTRLIRSAISIEHRLVADTDTGPQISGVARISRWGHRESGGRIFGCQTMQGFVYLAKVHEPLVKHEKKLGCSVCLFAELSSNWNTSIWNTYLNTWHVIRLLYFIQFRNVFGNKNTHFSVICSDKMIRYRQPTSNFFLVEFRQFPRPGRTGVVKHVAPCPPVATLLP